MCGRAPQIGLQMAFSKPELCPGSWKIIYEVSNFVLLSIPNLLRRWHLLQLDGRLRGFTLSVCELDVATCRNQLQSSEWWFIEQLPGNSSSRRSSRKKCLKRAQRAGRKGPRSPAWEPLWGPRFLPGTRTDAPYNQTAAGLEAPNRSPRQIAVGQFPLLLKEAASVKLFTEVGEGRFLLVPYGCTIGFLLQQELTRVLLI